MKKIILLIASVMFAVLAHAQILNYSVGQTVNDFTITDTKGNTHNLYTYTAAGKYVFLDFFFTTCPPCQATNPIWNEFYDKYGCNSGDVICISVNSGINNDAQVIAYETTYGGSFSHSPAVSSTGGSAAVDSDFNPQAYPTYCLVGPDNKLENSDIWPISSVAQFEAAFPSGFNPSPLACTVGLEENSTSLSMTIFPNPSSGDVKINFSNTDEVTYIEVLNILGDVIYGTTIESPTNYTLQLKADLFGSKGMYFVRIHNNKTTRSERIIIN